MSALITLTVTFIGAPPSAILGVEDKAFSIVLGLRQFAKGKRNLFQKS